MAITNYGQSYNGRRVVHPGAYDYIDASGMVVSTPGSLNIPIVIGEADAGECGVLRWFANPEEAREYLRRGDLVNALDLMFSPSPEGGGGASTVGVIVANTTVKATKVAGGITQSSLEHGEGGNRIQVKLENGTIAGTKRYIAYRWDTEVREIYDNLGAVAKIQYTGNQTYAELSITKDAGTGKALTLQTKIGPNSSGAVVDLNLDLTSDQFKTVEDVFRHISAVSGYTVSFVNYNNINLASSTLDFASAVDIKATAKYVTAVRGDLEYQINQLSKLVHIDSLATDVTNFEYTYLSGGSRGTAPSSWATYFDTIKSAFSDRLVVLSSSQAIQAEAAAHIAQMEQRNQKQVMFTGGPVGETAEQAKARAAMLNSSRVVVAYPDIYVKSVNDGKTALPAYITAAMIAGRVCGVDPSEPITFDYFNVVGLGTDLVEGDPVIDQLITSGVATLERAQNGGIRLVQGITTYLGSNNTLYREISVRCGADALSNKMRKKMEELFVGKKGVKATPSTVQTAAIDVLEEAVKNNEILGYKDIVVRFTGTAVYIDYKVSAIEPINFVFCTAHFVPDLV